MPASSLHSSGARWRSHGLQGTRRRRWLAILALLASGPASAHSLRSAPTLPLGSSYPTMHVYVTAETVVADFNGDSRLDVAVVLNNENALPLPEVATFLVNADGSFADPRHSALVGNVSGVKEAVAADFNQDGILDMAVTMYLSGVYSGSITVTHDAPWGGLTGKCVTLEPTTGFSFDTPMTARPR